MNEKFEHIDITLIDEDVNNHRLVIDAIADTELEQSVRTNGIQQPIKLCKKDDGRYILVWGFRRKAAAMRVGLTTIPAITVEGLTTSQIRALQAIENLERKELHPLEEAQFCADLADTIDNEFTGDRILKPFNLTELVAQRIGRSIKWVENRLAMSRLSERAKQAFIDNDIHLQHVNLIARLASHEAQEEVLGQVKAYIPAYRQGENKAEHKNPPATIAATRALVEQRLRDLSDVPWLLDAEFDGKNACLTCPHNSSNRLELFHDEAQHKSQCLLASCYAEKTKYVGRAIQRATNTAFKAAENNTGKNAGKPTKTQVEEAITEREITFVQPAAVIAATKRRQEPKTPTASETKGEKKNELRDIAQRELWSRQREWRNNIIEAIDKNLQSKKDPVALAIVILIYQSGIIEHACPENHNEKEQRAALTKLTTAINAISSKADTNLPGSHHPLHKAVQALKPYLTDNPDNTHSVLEHQSYLCDEDDSFVLEKIACAYKINHGPEPTVESIEAELIAAQNTNEAEAA
jgi:ParB/RepB/Spo0J family partition protein